MTKKEECVNKKSMVMKQRLRAHKAEASAAAKVGSEAAAAAKVANEAAAKVANEAAAKVANEAAAKVANEAAAKRATRDEVSMDTELRRKASFTRVFSDEELLEKFVEEGFDRILRGEITPKILISAATEDMEPHWRDGFLKDFLSLFPNSTYHDDSTSDLDVLQLVKIANDMECTALFQLVPLERDLGCIIYMVSLAKGASASFWCSNGEDHLNSAMMGASLNTSLSECIGRMIQSFFTNKDRNDLDFTCFGNNRVFKYIIGGRVGIQGVRAGPRFMLNLNSVMMGTYDTKSGEYERISLPQALGMESRR